MVFHDDLLENKIRESFSFLRMIFFFLHLPMDGHHFFFSTSSPLDKLHKASLRTHYKGHPFSHVFKISFLTIG